MSRLSIGLLVHLARSSANWEVRDEFLLETLNRSSLQRVDLLDLNGDGRDELVMEADFGGAETHGSSLQVFGLTGGNFKEVLNVYSRLEYMEDERYTQVLDAERTRQTHGRQFCVTKTHHPPLL